MKEYNSRHVCLTCHRYSSLSPTVRGADGATQKLTVEPLFHGQLVQDNSLIDYGRWPSEIVKIAGTKAHSHQAKEEAKIFFDV